MGREAGGFEGGVKGGEGLIVGAISLLAAIGIILWLTPKRRAIWIAIAVYLVGAIASVISVALSQMTLMTKNGEGDPQLMAGAISESIVSEGLASVVFIPLLIGLYLIVKRRRTKQKAQQDGSGT